MFRSLLLASAIFLAPSLSLAQTPDAAQCQQVRQAVAQYGYAAARRHALANYGPDAVRAGDQCLGRHYGAHAAHGAHAKKHYRTKSWS